MHTTNGTNQAEPSSNKFNAAPVVIQSQSEWLMSTAHLLCDPLDDCLIFHVVPYFLSPPLDPTPTGPSEQGTQGMDFDRCSSVTAKGFRKGFVSSGLGLQERPRSPNTRGTGSSIARLAACVGRWRELRRAFLLYKTQLRGFGISCALWMFLVRQG